jgi:hypothetical protein
MAFEEIASTDSSNTIALGGVNKKTGKPNPTSVTGYYLGSKEVTTGFGPAQVHNLQTDSGIIGVWGKTDMNKKLNGVPEGVLVRITQSGMKKIPGRNPMWVYKVEVDKSDTLDTGVTAEEENDEFPTSLTADDDHYEETDVDADEESADEVSYKRATPRKTAPSVDADRQARTKALLSKGQSANK